MFPDDMLVDYANFLLKAAGSPMRVTGVKEIAGTYVHFAAEGARGGRAEIVAPMGTRKIGLAFFRSLLKVQPNARKVAWLINGQHSAGTSEIAFYGENGPWLSTAIENVRAYYGVIGQDVREDGKERFGAFVDGLVREVLEEGLVGDEPQVISWDDGQKREPLRSPAAAPSA